MSTTLRRSVMRVLTFLLRDATDRFTRIRQTVRPTVQRPRTRRARLAHVAAPAVQLALF